ncbi:MAG: hypothetical protein ACOCZ5_00240 [bacterium]
MKNGDLFELNDVISSILKESRKIKLNFLLLENQNLLNNKIELLSKLFVTPVEIKKFEKERIELCKMYSEKDENGKPKIENDKFVGLLNNIEYKQKYDELENKYRKDIDEYNKQVVEYEKMLDEECDIEFKKIDINFIPDDLLTGQQLKILTPLLKME